MHKKPRRGAEDEFDYRDVSCVEPMLLSDVDRHMVDAVKHWLETASIERLFEEIVKMDLEGIVAKRKDSPYKVTEKPSRYWIKVKNARYSQAEGREEFV